MNTITLWAHRIFPNANCRSSTGISIPKVILLLSIVLASSTSCEKKLEPEPKLIKPRVLLISNSGDQYDFTRFAKDGLIETGLFTEADIDILENPETILLSELELYGATLVWTNESFHDPQNIGDLLKNYVDEGGGLVLATYSLSNFLPRLNGGIIEENYSPFSPGDKKLVPGLIDLGSLPNPNHPIFNNIVYNPTYWSNQNYSDPLLNNGGTILAVDTEGNKVVAENPNGKVIYIEIFPGILENPDTNGSSRLMFANSLYYVFNK